MDNLELSIKSNEGLKLNIYLDTEKKWTIGWGRNLSDKGITLSEAQLMFENDIAESRKELNHYDWFNALDKVRQEVLIELNFNLGLPKLLTFTTMLEFIKNKEFTKASIDLLNTKWAKEVHEERANNIANRLKTGFYANSST